MAGKKCSTCENRDTCEARLEKEKERKLERARESKLKREGKVINYEWHWSDAYTD